VMASIRAVGLAALQYQLHQLWLFINSAVMFL